jgi:hypothetical protein
MCDEIDLVFSPPALRLDGALRKGTPTLKKQENVSLFPFNCFQLPYTCFFSGRTRFMDSFY